MASLNSRQECPPAKALHTSQDVKSFRARRASHLRKSSMWVLTSWNVRTLLDVWTAVLGKNHYICDGHKYMRWLRMHAMPKHIGDGDVLLVEATDKACQ